VLFLHKPGRCRIVALAVLLAAMAGCTRWREYVHNGFKVGPNYCPPCAATADKWIDDADPNVLKRPPDDAAWWQTFHDPTLDRLVHAAYRQNLTLRAAGLRILQVRAQRDIVAGNLFPQTQQLQGDYTRTNLSPNAASVPVPRVYDDWNIGGSLAWELDFWGQFRRALESADAKLDASIDNYDAVLVLLLSEVAGQYIDVRTAEQRLKYVRENIETQRKSLGLAETKFQNGATTKLDVTQGESNLEQVEAAAPPLVAARRQAANKLCTLLGMPPQEMDAMLGKLDIPKAPPDVAVGIPADLLRRRPDIRRAEREVAAQCAQIGVATAELYPHFSLAGTIYYDAENFKDLFNVSSLAGSVGPSFRWNVLNYGRLLAGIRVQDARFQELATEYQNAVLEANAEAENALVGFLQAQQQVKHLAAGVEASKQSLELVQSQYQEGKADFNRVLDIERILTQQEDQWSVARGSVSQNLTLLYKALGGGWQIRLEDAESPDEEAPADVEPVETPLPAERRG
jgi:NodT family efflux transporter outer membrane factor (OMF) lipoprotein